MSLSAYFLVAAFGACVGSFLNVVIYRLPLMLEHEWQNACARYSPSLILSHSDSPEFSLSLPRSHCPQCQKFLSWYHNIPLLSYIVLKGACAYCHQKIRLRYPLVESIALLTSVFLLYHFGLNIRFAAMLIASYILIAAIFIDLEHQLLPDSLTLFLLWLGLLASTIPVFVSPSEAITGAAAGYMSLWLVGSIYTFFMHREGLGHGDYKLLAALGAWVGWQQLCWVVLLASLTASVIAIGLLIRGRANRKTAIAFGPYLAVAGFIVILWGNMLNNTILGIR